VNRRHPRGQGRGYSERIVDTRNPRERFLVVCEGEKTEPNYFRGFRFPGRTVDIRGMGDNTVSLVRKAISLNLKEEYDQVWCVFDRDAFPAQHFNEAISLAHAHNIKVSYSNEAFELWYILHFDYHQSAILRADYIKILSKKLGHGYKKSSETIYDELADKMPMAVQNAQKLLANYDPPKPASDNPSTTVHLLVLELLKSSAK
jgi:RloB-like protein